MAKKVVKKAAAKKASGKKASGKKASGKKASGKKASGKKVSAATSKKAVGKAVKKSLAPGPRKAVAKRASRAAAGTVTTRRKAPKTLMLIRAAFVDGARTLRSYIDSACRATPDLRLREVAHPVHGTLRINVWNSSTNGTFIQLVAKQSGENADTVSDAANVVNDNEVPVPPPTNRAFKNGDLFALVRNDNLVICSDGVRFEALRYYLVHFFAATNQPNAASQFDLSKVANANAVAQMQRGGVKEIKLSSSLYSASADRIGERADDRSLSEAFKKLVDNLAAVFEKDINEELAERSEKIQVEVVVKAAGGIYGEPVVLSRMEEVGVDVVNEDDGEVAYVIRTNDHKEIKSNEIIVRMPVMFERLANQTSLPRAEVFDALVTAMDIFERDGDLEI